MGRETRVLGALRRGAAAAVLLGLGLAPARAADLGTVEGVVLRVDGTPVPYAQVLIVAQRKGDISDESGRFRLRDVRPGHWQIEFRSLGTPSLVDSITVAAGDTVRRTFRMARIRTSFREGVDSVIAEDPAPPRLDARLEARMREARDVRIFRLDPTRYQYPPPADTLHWIGDWPIVSEVRRPRPPVDSLLPVLRRPDLYCAKAAGAIKPCDGFSPGIAVRYAGAGPATDLLLCYKCGEFTIRSRDGLIQSGDFMDQGAAFVRFARAAFPLDPAIQALGRPRADD
jgi:hypothetical protein